MRLGEHFKIAYNIGKYGPLPQTCDKVLPFWETLCLLAYLFSVRFSRDEYFPRKLRQLCIWETLHQLVLELVKLTVAAEYLLLVWRWPLDFYLVHLNRSKANLMPLQSLLLLLQSYFLSIMTTYSISMINHKVKVFSITIHERKTKSLKKMTTYVKTGMEVGLIFMHWWLFDKKKFLQKLKLINKITNQFLITRNLVRWPVLMSWLTPGKHKHIHIHLYMCVCVCVCVSQVCTNSWR